MKRFSRRIARIAILGMAFVMLLSSPAFAYKSYTVTVFAGPPVSSIGAGAKIIIYGRYGKYFETTARSKLFILPKIPRTISPVGPSFAAWYATFNGVPEGSTRIRVIFIDGRENNIYPNIPYGGFRTWWWSNQQTVLRPFFLNHWDHSIPYCHCNQ